MTFIESEMAKRNQRTIPAAAADSDASGAKEEASGAPLSSDLPQREPASLGKLHEIDLGQETKLENIARTKAATRRLAGEDHEEVGQPREDEIPTQNTPTRRDERSWRHQKRRTSEDDQRDRLVEEVLRESRRKFQIIFFFFKSRWLTHASLQSMFTTNPRRSIQLLPTIKPPMIGSQSNSEGTSSMPFSLVAGWHEPEPRKPPSQKLRADLN